jgi:xylulokinase
MKEACILVVDFGTSNVRASQVTLTGEIRNISCQKIEVLHPDYNYAEIDLDDLWAKTQQVIENIWNRKNGAQFLAMSFSFLGDSLILVDEKQQPIGNMIVSFDRRAEKEAEILKQEFGEENFLQVTGSKVLPELLPSKLMWLKKHAKAEWQRTNKIWNLQQYLMNQLGLADQTDYTLASRKCLFDIQTETWNDKLIHYLKIEEEKTNQTIQECSTIIGTISRIGDTNLGQELPVILGAHDSECAMLGLGVDASEPELVGNIMGTFDLLGSIRQVKKRPDQTAYPTLEVTHGLEKGTVIVGGSIIAGAYLEWFMREIVHGEKDFTSLNASVDLDNIQQAAFLLQNENQRNHLLDFDLSFSMDDLFKAIIEGSVYELAKIFTQMEAEQDIKRLRIGGGGSQSDPWAQLKADVFGLPVERVKNKEVSSIGAAIIAGVGLGIFADYSEGIAQMVKVEKCFQPNVARGKKYINKYKKAERRL